MARTYRSNKELLLMEIVKLEIETDQSVIEQVIQVHQNRLPRLPVPSLADTGLKYLDTVEPLVLPFQYQVAQENVRDFIEGQGKELYEKLLLRNQTEPYSWLETWWNEKAYFEYRERLPINVSFQMEFPDCSEDTRGEDRGAHLIFLILLFRDRLESGEIEPEVISGNQNCMNAYTKFFNACRIPKYGKDYTVC
eukprot:TRINITY_DN4733_c0_g1_i2.p1 TRINITY_DN4733_c0_g1~~TRINITY_DN4733_c0_g1_i2.p1  ORF type:complete len:194 (-),score=39.65 TRINITY_DN4733_c0_g1_i2:68-649(-)